MSIARPNKTAGRIIVGPRQVEKGYARIVACEDGSGRIELYDLTARSWCDACGECTFSELWSAPSVSEPFSSEAWIKVGATNGAVAGNELANVAGDR
ncbi:MAG: hypothetical protein JWN13_6298 [Betaproteobacteria bacterium]|jgi:hypothetical protein|nr:hypothetical protein [Betaproteobacteria bacterium]MEA3154517.1 hypothetical protein [Betaproteobacteria bacterium]